MEKTKNNQTPERPSLSKYDALTNKSTSNILVVNNERGVIQDYVDYLATNNNPYGMFWIHYNNSTNPVTKTLNESIRKEYFRKIGLSPVAPSHRLYAIGDYVENISPLELTLKNYPGYNTTDENIIKILKNNKNTYNKSTESYTLSGGTIKPNARFKVLDIVESKDSLRSYLNPIIGRFISDKDDAVDVETTIVYNRQNKIRAVPKVLNLSVSFGKYNNASKKQEGITITNYKTNTVIAKFDLPYGAYLDVVENLKMLDTSQGVVSDFIPSYIGSSHTAQGNSIKNVIPSTEINYHNLITMILGEIYNKLEEVLWSNIIISDSSIEKLSRKYSNKSGREFSDNRMLIETFGDNNSDLTVYTNIFNKLKLILPKLDIVSAKDKSLLSENDQNCLYFIIFPFFILINN